MTVDLVVALAMFAFVSSITPGPNNLMLMASGTNFGFRRTVPHLLGVALGFTAMVILVGAGLARVFTMYPAAQTALKVVSVAYLVWLAWKVATAAPPGTPGTLGPAARPLTFLQAALFQWVNPKAWSMALTALSAYASPAAPVVSLLVIAAVFGMVNLPSVSVWTLMGVQLRRFLDDPRRLRAFNLAAAILLLASLIPILR